MATSRHGFMLFAVCSLLLARGAAHAETLTDAARLTSGEAWAEFCDRMRVMGERIMEDDFPGSDLDRAEGFRHLARTVIMALEWEVEFSDTEFPAFYRHDDDVTKWGGPNVDNSYVRARIDGQSTYRITGNLTGIHDVIISPRNGDMHQGKLGITADLDSSQLDIAKDGSFALTLSPEPAPEGVKNWIQLPPDVDHVGVRQYFYHWDRETPAEFQIVKVGNEGKAPPRVTPTTRLVKLSELRKHLPPDTPHFDAAARREQIARRQAHVQRRFRR